MSSKPGSSLRLATLFSLAGLLMDRDGDSLPDRIQAALVLGDRAALPEQIAAAHLAARLGFETLCLELPLARFESYDGAIPIFVGRPGTLAAECPVSLVGLTAGCGPGEGIVAVASHPGPAVLVGGTDAEGLQAAALALATDSLADAAPVNDPPSGIEAVRVRRGSRPGTPAIPDQPYPPLRSLADLFGPAGLAVDTDGDMLPDSPRARLVLPSDLSQAEAILVIHLAARLGLESLGLILPFVIAANDHDGRAGNLIPILIQPLSNPDDQDSGGSISLRTASNGQQQLVVQGDADGRVAALAALLELDVWTPEERPTLAAAEQGLSRLLALADPAAAPCAILPAVQALPSLLASLPAAPLALSLDIPEGSVASSEAVAGCVRAWVEGVAPARPVSITVGVARSDIWIDQSQTLAWEVEEAWRLLRAEVFPALSALPPGASDWHLDLRLSESQGRREAIRQEILAEARSAGLSASGNQVRVLPSYHQGRAWLLEEIVPSLYALPVAALVVRVRPLAFQTPAIELPIRWLQDLFPVDEMLANRLNLTPESIRLDLVENLPWTYEVEAIDSEGLVLLRDHFEVVTTTRPYLPGFPAWGSVSPPSGCLRLTTGAGVLVDHLLAPDPERAWDWLQTTILPQLADAVRQYAGPRSRRDRQPFFGELAIDIWLSEEDGPLGVREERNSPLEALHEDLYFMLLDFCTALMTETDPQPYVPPWLVSGNESRARRDARRWTAPGRIVPRVHRRDGMAGKIQVLLRAPDPPAALCWQCGEAGGTLALRPAREVSARIVGLEFGAKSDRSVRSAPVVVLALDGPTDDVTRARALLEALGDLRAAGVECAPSIPSRLAIAAVNGPSAPLTRRETPDPKEARAGLTGAREELAGPIPWDRVLTLNEVNRQIGRLGVLPSVHAFVAGHSAGGRPLWAMEVTVPRLGGWWSRAKLGGWKCSLLLNGRHHANEPASTSAMLRLAELLAGDEQWVHFLQRVNVIFLPGENADGMAFDDELTAEHPTWMHHPARYNAAGLEFAAAYQDPITPHSEALALPMLWRRWAPDIFCDNHGFPSHAWEQPFSGHANPWFRAFWIPQALIYAYLPTADTPQHRAAAARIGECLVDTLANDPEIARWNEQHAGHYRTYLNDRLPERFPAPYERGVLLHHSRYEPGSGNEGNASFPGRYPQVTTASLVTEVADETAQGPYLALCARAHLLANRALLEYLFDANGPASVRRVRQELEHGGVLLRATRPRPVLP
ncbi:MAG TPA: M14 family metallopeptidase [Chloroflexota bacterium]